MSHPSICLAASPATQTPVSRVSPEPCLLHPLHVVSVWAGAGGPGPAPSGWTAGAWSWHRPLATGAVRWGTGGTRGGGSHPRPSRGPAGGVLAAPGGLRTGRGGPESCGWQALGTEAQGGETPTEGSGASAPDPQPLQSLSQGFPVLLPGQPVTVLGVCAGTPGLQDWPSPAGSVPSEEGPPSQHSPQPSSLPTVQGRLVLPSTRSPQFTGSITPQSYDPGGSRICSPCPQRKGRGADTGQTG